MNRLKRIQFVSQNYAILQGLKSVPFWIVALLLGITMLMRHTVLLVPTMVVLALSFAIPPWLYLQIRTYYAEKFGYAQSRPNTQDGVDTTLLIVGVLLDNQFHPPVSLFFLFGALFAVHNWRQAPALRVHYLVGAVVLLLFAVVVPMIALPDRVGAMLIIVSALNLVGGVYDHLLLIKLIREARDESSHA